MGILDFIGYGKENAVTRATLCALMGLPDREVRRQIAEARSQGYAILNDQDGKGYYISNDLYELRRQFSTNRARAMSILKQQKALRRHIEAVEARDQIAIEEVGGSRG